MDDQVLSEPPRRSVDLRPSQATRRGTRSLGGADEMRRHLTSPSPAASPMDLDDLLTEILLAYPRCRPRSPWRPSSAPAGAASSRTPASSAASAPTTGDPSASSSAATTKRDCQADCDGDGRRGYAWVPHGSRHGREVLSHSLYGHGTREFLVWNPVTGEHHFLDITRFLDPDRNQNGAYMKGAVIRAASDKGPFKFALAWDEIHHGTAHICVYSSETSPWGDVVSAAFDSWSTVGLGNVMVGNTLYSILFGNQVHILQFDLGTQDLAVIEVPPSAYEDHYGIYLCTLADGFGPSLIVMSADLRAQLWVLWERTADSDGGGGARWMRGRIDRLLGLRPGGYWKVLWLAGDDNLIFVSTYSGVFMVHLESMQSEKIFETSPLSDCRTVHPLKNLYAPGPF
ncbi:unnamed protein product [Miscanthus lutarioriparius]|uniref:Uncharacterized protein n=1 Tax=Miscanthus lutarioriparius TaxID=422564 RepID=A0A811QJD6_9POAL|nr:unnamed protein product [Miscanthus lutarioriparius]